MIMDALKHYGVSQRTDLSKAINLPLRNTKRIKFTCCDASDKYLIFGANSGSLYVYDRATVNFLSIIPSQLGTISQVLISRNGRQIAVANLRGAIGVVLDLDDSSTTGKEVLLTELGDGNGGSSRGAFVTCFCWGAEDRELYCGDSRGTVSLLQLSMFMGRNILNLTLNPVLLLENQIVQIDRYGDLLLVSTQSKCVLCNTEREEFKQIGNRPRDGPYGAAFIVANDAKPRTPQQSDNDDEQRDDNENDQLQQQQPSPSTFITPTEDVRIFCARPGSRLWEANLDGNVLRTHQFKQQQHNSESEAARIVPFNRLYTVRKRLILVHDEREVVLIDPIASRVVLAFADVGEIERVAIVGEQIYVFAAEQKMVAVRVQIEVRERAVTGKENGKKSSPFKENGVYILDHLFNNNNNNGGKEGGLQTEVTIKEALVSVVRGKYGRNIRQMFLGYDQIGPERPKTLNISKVYNNEENYNKVARVLPTDEATSADAEEVVEEECGEEVVPKRNPPKKMFSMSLLSDYQLSEDDKTVRNLYLVYRSSIISNLNFADRYAKIFDAYDTNTIVGLLQKLEAVMDENNEDHSRLNCIRIYFDYLKVELIWEIDDDSRAYIKQSFIEYNRALLTSELRQLEQCESCGHYLRPNATCHYQEIGTTLVQYFWSRKEYPQCFELVAQIPHLWLQVTRFYVQDRREDKVIQCLWNLGDRELLERAAGEMFTLAHWRQLLDLMLTCYNSNCLMCLNCDKLCALADADRNPMAQLPTVTATAAEDNNTSTSKSNNNAKPNRSSSSGSNFYSWNYILNVAIASSTVSGKDLLQLLRGYDEYIPKGAIGTGFYLKCLLDATD